MEFYIFHQNNIKKNIFFLSVSEAKKLLDSWRIKSEKVKRTINLKIVVQRTHLLIGPNMTPFN